MLAVTLWVIPALITKPEMVHKSCPPECALCRNRGFIPQSECSPFVTRTPEQSSSPGGWSCCLSPPHCPLNSRWLSCCLSPPHCPLSSSPGGWFVIYPLSPQQLISAVGFGYSQWKCEQKRCGRALDGLVEGKGSVGLQFSPGLLSASEFSYLGMKGTESS